MPLGSILLRLLLSLVLAFNGVATAHAGIHLEHMAPPAPMQAAATESSEAMAGMPCHDMAGMEQAAAGFETKPTTATDPGDGMTPKPDCCKAGCQCVCLQHATPAIAMVAFAALIVHDSASQEGMHAHAPPAVLRLNRPPIG